MLARNSTLQSMKKAARLQVCTIVLRKIFLDVQNQKRKISKITIKRRDLHTYLQTYKSGRVLLTVLRTVL